MTKPPLSTSLRNLATLALVAVLALGSGCSGDFLSNDEGPVSDSMEQAFNPETGIAVLGLTQVPVEIDAEGGAIIFDFSNVTEPGVLSTLQSGGFQLDGKVLGVSIDVDLTDADSDALVIQSDRHGITINFDDLEYDDTTFIKIDVRFADAS